MGSVHGRKELRVGRYRFLIFMKFGRTDLRRGASGAKLDAESDFEVRLAVAPQKPDQNREKLIFRSEKFTEKIFLASKNEMSGIV